jgi:hypothetical protein
MNAATSKGDGHMKAQNYSSICRKCSKQLNNRYVLCEEILVKIWAVTPYIRATVEVGRGNDGLWEARKTILPFSALLDNRGMGQ